MAHTPTSSSSLLLCVEDAGDIASWTDARSTAATSTTTTSGDIWDLPFAESGDQFLATLLASEPDLMPRPDYLSRLRNRSLDASSRQHAVAWILKVTELFRFRPVTGYLAVSYLDRFLSTHSLPDGGGAASGGWPMQLVTVACVSVAAKMEETQVPMLIDLQSLDSGARFLFEPRTVRRMELLLMSALQWRVQGTTPFDFLPFFAPNEVSSPFALLPHASDLIVSTQRVVDFLGYRPSEIAAAALLCAAEELAHDKANFITAFEKFVEKDTVSGCCQLMKAHLLATCPSSAGLNKPGQVSLLPPPSPIGVLDAAACGSCDSQRSSAPATPSAEPNGPDPPPFKRRRVGSGPGPKNCIVENTGEDEDDNTGEDEGEDDDGLDLLCND